MQTSSKLENTVLTSLIVVGVGLGIYFRMTGDNQLSAVLFSLAFASVLYKFLGGEKDENSLTLGVVKFGGSAAVLGGFIWLLSKIIFVNDALPVPAANYNFTTEPSKDWYAADIHTGAPIAVNLSLGDTSLRFPMHEINAEKLQNRRFQLNEIEKGRFNLFPLNDTQNVLGKINLEDIKCSHALVDFKISNEGSITIFTTYPNRSNQRSSEQIEKIEINNNVRERPYPFPFVIKTVGTSFSIKIRGADDYLISDREVVRKTPIIINDPNEQRQWFVFVAHASFILENPKDYYVEWVVEEIIPSE